MAYANGLAPREALIPILPRMQNGAYPIVVSPAVWASLYRMEGAFRAAGHGQLRITDGYRDLATQERTFTTRYRRGYPSWDMRTYRGSKWGLLPGHASAAVPGTSNHGGFDPHAVDLASGINSFGTKTHEWMRKHGRAFGFVHPAWAQRGGRFPEAWHWEHTWSRDTFRGQPIAFAADLQRALVRAGHALTVDGHYGTGTRRELVIFQEHRGLAGDAILGPLTLAALGIDQWGTTTTTGAGTALADLTDEEIDMATAADILARLDALDAKIDRAFGHANEAADPPEYGSLLLEKTVKSNHALDAIRRDVAALAARQTTTEETR